MVNERLTQEPVEVLVQATGTDLQRRLTQEPVEVLVQATGTDLQRRLTQIVIEVLITQPVAIFGQPPDIEYPMWSPAYTQPPVEGEAINYTSYWGYHSREIILGLRRQWLKMLRR